jgi:hypothetical protein
MGKSGITMTGNHGSDQATAACSRQGKPKSVTASSCSTGSVFITSVPGKGWFRQDIWPGAAFARPNVLATSLQVDARMASGGLLREYPGVSCGLSSWLKWPWRNAHGWLFAACRGADQARRLLNAARTRHETSRALRQVIPVVAVCCYHAGTL